MELFRDKTRIQLLHKVFLVLSNFKVNKMDIGKDLRLPFRVLQINRDLEKLRVKVSNRLLTLLSGFSVSLTNTLFPPV